MFAKNLAYTSLSVNWFLSGYSRENDDSKSRDLIGRSFRSQLSFCRFPAQRGYQFPFVYKVGEILLQLFPEQQHLVRLSPTSLQVLYSGAISRCRLRRDGRPSISGSTFSVMYRLAGML